MNRKTRNVLIEAAALIQNVGWTQKYYARDKRGKDIPASHKRAVRFCASGAIDRSDTTMKYRNEATGAMQTIVGSFVTQFNDAPGRTKEEVVQVLLEAAHS